MRFLPNYIRQLPFFNANADDYLRLEGIIGKTIFQQMRVADGNVVYYAVFN